jgi:hypothetical protein
MSALFSIGNQQISPSELAELPPFIKEEMRRGFSVLPKIKPEQYGLIVSSLSSSIADRTPINPSELAGPLGISELDTGALLSAVGTLSFTLSTGGSSVEEIISILSDVGLLEDAARDSVVEFSKFIESHKETLKRGLSASRATTASLPLLDAVEIAIDLRFSFREGFQTAPIPMAIIRFGSERGDQEFYCQLTRAELQRLTEVLQKSLENMDKAAAFAEKAQQ